MVRVLHCRLGAAAWEGVMLPGSQAGGIPFLNPYSSQVRGGCPSVTVHCTSQRSKYELAEVNGTQK